MIIFNEQLVGTDLQKVRTYLATKYGLTLSGGTVDYLNTSGTVVWDSSDNAGYWNDIAGFGRDDAEDLNQVRSRSANADAAVTMTLPSSEALDDQDYFYWANDDGILTGTVTTGLAANLEARTERIWKVEETGSGANPI